MRNLCLLRALSLPAVYTMVCPVDYDSHLLPASDASVNCESTAKLFYNEALGLKSNTILACNNKMNLCAP